MDYNLTYDGQELPGKYTGSIMNKLPSGNGTFTATGGDYSFTYTGEWEDGSIAGAGTLDYDKYVVHFTDGVNREGKYSGETLDGIASGSGTFTATNDEGYQYTYTGEWLNGLYNGYGVVKFDDPEMFVQDGNFVDGEFAPTPVQFFAAEGSRSITKYTIVDNAKSFLETYPDTFIENSISSLSSELIDSETMYGQISKNPSKFGDKLIVANNLSVVQISESETWGKEVTRFIAIDNDFNIYYCCMYNVAEGVYEGSNINLTYLPLDYFTYQTTDNSSKWAIACAGVSVDLA